MKMLAHLAGSRIIGSYGDGWLALSRRASHSHIMYNLADGRIAGLADTILLIGMHSPAKVVIHAAATSCNPCTAEPCLISTICTLLPPARKAGASVATFFSLGTVVLKTYLVGEFEDTIFFKGSFHCLTRTGDILLTRAATCLDGGVSVRFAHKLLSFVNVFDGHHGFVASRYLVASRGELLMVTRHSSVDGGPATCFIIYQMVQIHPIGVQGRLHYWKALNKLDGRLIFLARGSPRVTKSSTTMGLKKESISSTTVVPGHGWTGASLDQPHIATH